MTAFEIWWSPPGREWTLCPAGQAGDSARRLLPAGSVLRETVEAPDHDAARPSYLRVIEARPDLRWLATRARRGLTVLDWPAERELVEDLMSVDVADVVAQPDLLRTVLDVLVTSHTDHGIVELGEGDEPWLAGFCRWLLDVEAAGGPRTSAQRDVFGITAAARDDALGRPGEAG